MSASFDQIEIEKTPTSTAGPAAGNRPPPHLTPSTRPSPNPKPRWIVLPRIEHLRSHALHLRPKTRRQVKPVLNRQRRLQPNQHRRRSPRDLRCRPALRSPAQNNPVRQRKHTRLKPPPQAGGPDTSGLPGLSEGQATLITAFATFISFDSNNLASILAC